MTNTLQLPEGYTECMRLDIQKDKRLALLVNGLSLMIGLVMLVCTGFRPFAQFYGVRDLSALWVRYGVLIAALVGYIVLHELVHGVFIRVFSGQRAHYGFTGLYGYAGSDAYFTKKSYLLIAMAPVVLWGVVLLVLQFVIGAEWFWMVYLIQVANLSGAAGDFYVAARFAGLPADILVQDSGVAMTVYARRGTS